MRVVLTKQMVVGHVMRYPGEVVDVPDVPVLTDQNAPEVEGPAVADADEADVPAPLRRRKKTASRPGVLG